MSKGGVFMEDQITTAQETNPTPAIRHKNKIGLPLIALGLELVPIPLMFLSSLFESSSSLLLSFLLLLVALLPVAGLVAGIFALSRGKKRIGTAGMVLSIIAVALPVLIVILSLVFFIVALPAALTNM